MPPLIEIESDDEDTHQNPFTGLAGLLPAAGEEVEPASVLHGRLAELKAPVGGPKKLRKIGDISITLADKGLVGTSCILVSPDAELELAHLVTGRRVVVPLTSIVRLALMNNGAMVLFFISSHEDFTNLRDDAQAAGSLWLDRFVLNFAHDVVKTVVVTLNCWLPHVFTRIRPSSGVKSHTISAEVAPLNLDGIVLTAHDILLLGNERCLNDTCLDFFARLAVELVAPASLRGQIWVASTLFFQKLTSNSARSGEEGWHNVRQWRQFREDGVLTRRYLLVPINVDNRHWFLAAVCNVGRAFDPATNAITKGELPRIVCLDSSLEPEAKTRVASFLRGYLWREWCEREMCEETAATAIQKKSKVASTLKSIIAEVPKQTNGYDCGLFYIEYILHVCRSDTALAALGLISHMHWFQQDTVSHRRQRLRWAVATLQLEASKRGEMDVGRLLQDDQLRRKLVGAFTDQPKNKHNDAKRPRL